MHRVLLLHLVNALEHGLVFIRTSNNVELVNLLSREALLLIVRAFIVVRDSLYSETVRLRTTRCEHG